MARRRTSTTSVDISTESVEDIQTTVIEESKSVDSNTEELENRLTELETKYEKLVNALRMNGQVNTALSKFYD